MVQKIAHFLGRSLTAKQISDVVRRTRFDVMKHDSSVNYSWWDELGMRLPSESQFMRKGQLNCKLTRPALIIRRCANVLLTYFNLGYHYSVLVLE